MHSLISSQQIPTTDQLFSAGAISVTIGGNFIVTGSWLFPALVTDRVDQLVTELSNQIQSKLIFWNNRTS